VALIRFWPHLWANIAGSRIANRASQRLATLLIGIFCAGAGSLLQAQVTSAILGTVIDQQGLPIVGAEVVTRGETTGSETKSITDSDGNFAVLGLQPGAYIITADHDGFTTKVYIHVDLTLNRQIRLNITLTVGSMRQKVTVGTAPPILEIGMSSSGDTILPKQVESMPLNGRNYLDLLQLVPGVGINRNFTEGDDNSAPILGERANNAYILIDGMPNRDEVDGGPAGQFDQDSILEFQVLTSGYKAEFGRGSGGIVNVVTKSGTNEWRGSASLFHRNYLLDTPDVAHSAVPFLLRWDTGATIGGPFVKDRVFFFGAAERIREARQANFQFPADFPPSLKQEEESINKHGESYESRGFARVDEVSRRHRLTQELNLTNAHFRDSGDQPSLRHDNDLRRLMFGIHDTILLGELNNPYLLNAYFQYRGEPSVTRPAHSELGLPSVFVNLFSTLDTGNLFGDVTSEIFGPGITPLSLNEDYVSLGASFAKQFSHHGFKLGWDYQHTKVNGTESANIFDVLFATVPDFSQYGLVNSGVHVTFTQEGATPGQNLVRLRNIYDGLFVQDDWKVHKSAILNLGLRWDYDSQFPNKLNLSPRLGVSWSPNSKAVLSASWGVFYDHFRIGVARDIPAFGGAAVSVFQDISFPRLFYGDPSVIPFLGGLCLSPDQTDAQIAASGATCPADPSQQFYGIDHLNGVVAPGHASLPSNTIITRDSVTTLTGLTPQQFVDSASAKVGQPAGFFYWGLSGNLSMAFVGGRSLVPPIAVDLRFRTPYTKSFHVGLQRELSRNLAAYADYFHKDIRNILGVRLTNLAFEARLPDHTGETLPGTGNQPTSTYGPWFSGNYNALVVGVRNRETGRFLFDANYTFARAIDNLLNSSLNSSVQTGLGVRLAAFDTTTDSFVGIPPVVTDPNTGQTNANGSFIASNGNPVPQAGKYYYGPNLDRGLSDLAYTHTFSANGFVELPKGFQISAIFRVQSGFHYSRSFTNDAADVDGDGIPASRDFTVGRNHFVAPPFVNLDIRFSKWFHLGDRVRLEALIEYFNAFNRANPSQIQGAADSPVRFGTVTQVLPGREGQAGIKVEF
jgi:Carboxypeptidase regulatory-like domain/TonB dependent receptor/TonB-dependent Receptor Plug Domain